MTDGAGRGLAIAPGHQRRALGDAALGDEIGEARLRIAQRRALGVLRQHDDAAADRLIAAVAKREAHAAGAHVTRRHLFGLLHLVEAGRWLQCREIVLENERGGVRRISNSPAARVARTKITSRIVGWLGSRSHLRHFTLPRTSSTMR